MTDPRTKTPREMLHWTSKQVQEISRIRRDHEVAHGMEDDLYYLILQWLAADTTLAKGKRAVLLAAIDTKDISFPRYCS